MKEIQGNLWNVECDLRVLTTNGMIRKDGACVMGRGCAYEAKKRFPGIEFRLGKLLREHGNRVMRLGRYGVGEARTMICSFPVKHHWKQEADLALIRRSAEQLVTVADKFGHERILIPRPGCGNGKLSWADVRPILAEILDDRFSVITFPDSSQRSVGSGEEAGDRFKIELRAYGSPDDLGLGKYRPHLLDGEYPSKEAAEAEISRQEEILQASGAVATMVPVPVV